MARALAAALSALLMWLAFPPVDFGVLVFVAPVPMLWALRTTSSAWRGAGLGVLFGAAFFGATLSWLRVLGVVAWIPLVLVMAIGAGLCALVIAAAREWTPWRWWIAVGGAWALWEFLRARWPFGGFPWGSTGYPIGTMSWPRGSAQWIGASGWSVVVVVVAAGIVLLVTDREWEPLRLGGSVVIGLTLLGAVFAPSANGPEVRVAVVQGDSPCPRVHCPGEREIILDWHLDLTRSIPAGSADLIVWGENSFGGAVTPTFNEDVRAAMSAEAVRIGAYLLVSGTRSAGPDHFDNVNIVFDPQGRIVGEYMKRHPVPFGEYVPFRWLTGWIPQLDRVPRDMTRGDEAVVFPVAGGDGAGVFGSVISFEGAFSRMLRGGVVAGAQMMVVPTNEASFDEGPASDQLLGMVRMSAASLGVDVVVAAITGKSALIRADGSIVASTGLFEQAILTGSVALHQGRRTLYAVAGDWLQLTAIAGLAVVAIGTVGLRLPGRRDGEGYEDEDEA
jgi:apolipoprotein N-acyltransferase